MRPESNDLGILGLIPKYSPDLYGPHNNEESDKYLYCPANEVSTTSSSASYMLNSNCSPLANDTTPTNTNNQSNKFISEM